jgi:hypothetical protein
VYRARDGVQDHRLGRVNAITAEPITTRRLTLLPLSAGHADEMAAVLADRELYIFTGGSPPARQELRARYERWIAGSPGSGSNESRPPSTVAGIVQGASVSPLSLPAGGRAALTRRAAASPTP